MDSQPSRGISKDLSITTWYLVVAFALLSSAATYYVLLNRVENYTLNRMMHLTQEVARQSAYTLLVAGTTPSAPERFESSFIGVKDVQFAALLDIEGNKVAAVGTPNTDVNFKAVKTLVQTIIVKNTSNDVHLLAPVFLKREWNANEVIQPFGYVYVVASKETARRLALNVSMANIAVVVLLGSALLMWATKRTRRITRPLEQLVTTMNTLSTSTSMTARAEVRGAAECRAAATSFNALMDRLKLQQDELRMHADELESKVSDRTRELQMATTAAQSATRYKSEVMSAVTHEMKAPLYIIGVFAREAAAELEMMGGETGDIRKHLLTVIEEAGSLSDKISQILQVARLEKGAYEIKREWIELDVLCERVMSRLDRLATSNRNVLSHSVVGRRIWCDVHMLEQILMTVGTNACKFTTDGFIKVSVTVTDDYLKFEVEDTGTGISQEILPTVFEEFRQGDMSESRGFAGTGLGLSIAKRYAELLEGSIRIQSEVMKGTRVTVEIPLRTPLAVVTATNSSAAHG